MQLAGRQDLTQSFTKWFTGDTWEMLTFSKASSASFSFGFCNAWCVHVEPQLQTVADSSECCPACAASIFGSFCDVGVTEPSFKFWKDHVFKINQPESSDTICAMLLRTCYSLLRYASVVEGDARLNQVDWFRANIWCICLEHILGRGSHGVTPF